MIFKTLEFLRNNLNRYIQAENPDGQGMPSTDRFVILGEVSLLGNDGDGQIRDTVIMSLVYTEEESALKNSSPYFVQNNKAEVRNPPVFLNLGVIFCANFPTDYPQALKRISEVAKFFQSKSLFTFSGSPVEETQPFILSTEERDDLEARVEMMKLSLEEINHLWGILKVRVLPFVMYKVRLVQLEASRKIAEGGTIEEVQTSFE